MVHELEHNKLYLEKLQAIHDAEYRRVQGHMDRMAAERKASPSATCCDDIKAQLDSISKRMDKLEQLVILHDKAIREAAAGAKDTKVPKPE
jgi:hypothetical protein